MPGSTPAIVDPPGTAVRERGRRGERGAVQVRVVDHARGSSLAAGVRFEGDYETLACSVRYRRGVTLRTSVGAPGKPPGTGAYSGTPTQVNSRASNASPSSGGTSLS